jgi:hypothetical protein
VVNLFPRGLRWRGGIDDSTGRRIRMTRASLTHKAKCVCSACNGGWMSGIETASKRVLKPLIEGSRKRRVLTRKEQRILARWMTLRSMVFETQYPERNRYYTQPEREAFARTRSLDSVANVHVWLADFPGAPVGAAVNMEPIANPAKDAGRQLVTCHVGQIVIQLVAWKRFETMTTPPDKSPIQFDKLAATEWPQCAIQIWPRPARRLRWPPDLYLSPVGFKNLSNRFAFDKIFQTPPNRR